MHPALCRVWGCAWTLVLPTSRAQGPTGLPGLREVVTGSLGPGHKWGPRAYQQAPKALGRLRAGLAVGCCGAENGAPSLPAPGVQAAPSPAKARRPGCQPLSLVCTSWWVCGAHLPPEMCRGG